MPNEIRHKTSTTPSTAPTPAQLVAGELAINAADGKVYTRKADGTVVDLTDLQVMDGGEQFTPLNISNLALWLDGSDTTTLYQTQAGGAAAVTAPTDIAGCFAWWDASDASTLTVAPVTNRISQWNDKVGGRNFTASTTATQPLRETGTLNGRNVVRFEVATNMTVANDKTSWNFLHQPTGGGWLFMVLQPFNAFSAEQWGRVIATSNFSSALVGFDFFIDDRHSNAQQSGSARISIQRGVSGTSNAATVVLNSFPNDTGAYVVAIKCDPGNATAAERVRLFVNGVGGANITTATDAASTANASGDLTLGIGQSITGFVAEILIYNTLLTDLNRARIEKYLALKWGITSVTNTIAQDTAPITTPLGITNNTCALWLDGADANTMYNATTGGSLVTTNSAVLRWEDKSGNGRHATQSNSSVAPLRFLGGLNSRDVLSFNATRGMTAGAIGDWNFLHNAEGGSVFMVLKPALTADPQDFAYLLQTQNNTTTQVGFGLFYDDRVAGFNRNNYLSSFVFFGTSGQSVSGSEQNNFFTAANTYALVSVVVDSGCSSPVANRMAMYRDGTRLGPNNTQTNPPSTSNSATALQIGVTTGANSPGEIAEIIIFRRPLSDVDRARVENYLAAKWGLSVPNSQPPVGSWQDRSGNGRHATQATAANRPAVSSARTNTRSTLTWNGSTSRLRTSTSAGMSQTMSLFAVVKRGPTVWGGGGAGGYGTILGAGTSGNGPNLMIFNGVLWLTGGTNKSIFTPAGALGVTAPAIFSGTLQNGATSLYVNGALVNADPLTGSGADAGAIEIGAYNPSTGNGGPLAADIAELITYSRVLSAAERRQIEQYLAAKWGIISAPQVSNLDAQDWLNRVYLAGSTVTQSTAAAVNNFCNAIDSAGLRDRFYRLNLFCGNDLTACLVPLYRGPSLTATQLGNATDTNNNFIASDYAQTAGLNANNSQKHLDTGLQTLALPAGVIDSGHLSVSHGPLLDRGFDSDPQPIGATNSTTDRVILQIVLRTAATGGEEGRWGKTAIVASTPATAGRTRPSSFLLTQRTSATNLELWRDGNITGTNTTSTTGIAGIPYNIFVFRLNNTGTAGAEYMANCPLRHYSIGDDMTSAQVLAFRAALLAFHAALGRTA